MTPQEEELLSQLRMEFGGAVQEQAPEPVQGSWSRFGQRLANIPGKRLSEFASLGDKLFFGGQDAGNTRLPDAYDIPAAEPGNYGHIAADLGGGIGDLASQVAIPGGIVTKGARGLLGGSARMLAAESAVARGAATTGQKLLAKAPHMAGGFAGGAYAGAQQSPEEAAIMGTEFAGMSVISAALPGGSVGRVIGRGLLNAAIAPAGALARGHDPRTMETAITAATMGLLGSGGIEAAGRRYLGKRAPADGQPIPPELPPSAQPGIDDALFMEQELGRVRQQRAAEGIRLFPKGPSVPPLAPRQAAEAPKTAVILGPALAENNVIVRQGKAGELHGDLKMAAAKEDVDVTTAEHVFAGPDRIPLSREAAYPIAEANGQLNAEGIAKRATAEAKGQKPQLESQDLIKPGTPEPPTARQWWNDYEQRVEAEKKYTPAVKNQRGEKITGATHDEAKRKILAAGDTITESAYMDKEGNFLSLTEIARKEEAPTAPIETPELPNPAPATKPSPLPPEPPKPPKEAPPSAPAADYSRLSKKAQDYLKYADSKKPIVSTHSEMDAIAAENGFVLKDHDADTFAQALRDRANAIPKGPVGPKIDLSELEPIRNELETKPAAALAKMPAKSAERAIHEEALRIVEGTPKPKKLFDKGEAEAPAPGAVDTPEGWQSRWQAYREGNKGEAGYTDLGANPLTRFAPQIAGAIGGGAVGASNDPENRLRGFAIGAVAGAALPGASRQLLRTLRNPAKATESAQKLHALAPKTFSGHQKLTPELIGQSNQMRRVDRRLSDLRKTVSVADELIAAEKAKGIFTRRKRDIESYGRTKAEAEKDIAEIEKNLYGTTAPEDVAWMRAVNKYEDGNGNDWFFKDRNRGLTEIEQLARQELTDISNRPEFTPALEQSNQMRLRDARESGATHPDILARSAPYIGGALAGGVVGGRNDEENPLRGMLLGAAGGALTVKHGKRLFQTLKNPRAAIAEEQKLGVLPKTARTLFPKAEAKLEKAAQEQERNRPSLTGKVARFFERDVMGPGEDVKAVLEKGRGYAAEQAERVGAATKKVAPFYKTATPAQFDAVKTFNAARGAGPAEEATLRGAIGHDAADGIIELRRAEEHMQQTYATADPTKGNLVADTLGTYDTRAFQAFLNPDKWKPTVAHRDAFTNLLSGSRFFAGFDRWQIASAVDEYGQNIRRKATGEAPLDKARSSQIDKALWMKRKDLDPEVRQYLGEITNPVEARVLTNAKLIKSAANAKAIGEMMKLKDESGSATVMTREQLRDAVRIAGAAGKTAEVERLKAYQEFPDKPGYGKLGGMVAPREFIDAMNAHREALGSGYQKFFSAFNSTIKEVLTADNPATHARNWYQVFQQGLIMRVYNPVRYAEAVGVIHEKRDLWRKMVRLGIANADMATAELRAGVKDLETMLGLKKQGVLGKLKAGRAAVHKFYGMPDNVTRIAGFIENEPRFLKKGQAKGLTGAALTEFAETETMKFVNRYSQNYARVSNLTKMARNKPLVSPFISYTAEMGRMLKNLGEDVIHGDAETRAWAIGNLAQLTALPLVIASIGTAALSKEDRDAWTKTQKMSPAWSRGQIQVPLRRRKDGTFEFMAIGPITPAGDYVAMARALARGEFDVMAQVNPVVGIQKTPLINLAATLISKEDPMTHEPVKTWGQQGRAVARTVLPPWAPGIGAEARRAERAFTPNVEGGYGITNQRTGRRDTPADSVRGLFGMRTGSVQPKSLFRNAQFEAQEALRSAAREAKQITGTNASPEVQAKARKRLFEKRKAIREERNRKLVTAR